MLTETELERAIFTLPSLLCEMERYHLTDNINMCGLFARRGEDFVGLLRVCASLLALQSNVTSGSTRVDSDWPCGESCFSFSSKTRISQGRPEY